MQISNTHSCASFFDLCLDESTDKDVHFGVALGDTAWFTPRSADGEIEREGVSSFFKIPCIFGESRWAMVNVRADDVMLQEAGLGG